MKKLIILIVLIELLFSSCGTGEPESTTEFVIENTSSHIVELTVFNAILPDQYYTKDTTFWLSSNSEINYYYNLDGENVFFDLPFEGVADSAYVIFSDTLQIIYRRDDLNPRNILDVNSWNGVKESDTYFKYTYLITDEDYNNAVNIE